MPKFENARFAREGGGAIGPGRSLRARRLNLGKAAVALLVAAFGANAEAQSPPRQSLDLATPGAAEIVPVGDGLKLVSELHVTSFSNRPITLDRVEVMDGTTTVAALAGTGLDAALGWPGRRNADHSGRAIEPGGSAVVYIDAPYPSAQRAHKIWYRVQVETPTQTGALDRFSVQSGAQPLDTQPLPILSPPLKGGPWTAVYAPEMERGHRRVFYAVDGRARLPGRFAIDWFKLDDAGKAAKGNGQRAADFYGYGAEVLAVTDGVITATRDGMAEATDPKHAPPLADAAGNYVVLALGHGRYAFYEHLQSGLLVKPGDKVRRGQIIARLGASGEAPEPHLHFHVADGPDPLAAEGMPYRLTGYQVIGRYASIDDFERIPWTKATTEAAARPSLPAANAVVRFKGR